MLETCLTVTCTTPSSYHVKRPAGACNPPPIGGFSISADGKDARIVPVRMLEPAASKFPGELLDRPKLSGRLLSATWVGLSMSEGVQMVAALRT